MRTPNLDRLAAGGVSFRRHFAQAAPCGPSRAALYTGMYLMNHRSVLNGTPLDARHDNVALVARRLGYEPALFGYTDTSIDPRTVAPDDARLFRYEGVLPGFDPVCHLPEGEPFAWLEWMRADGVDVPDEWRTFVDRPAAGPDVAHAVRRRALADHVPHRPVPRVGRRAARPTPAGGSRTCRSCARTRRSSRPRRTTRCSIPRRCPRRCARRRRADEGAQHPLLGVMIDHPFLKSPDDEQEQRELQATYYGMLAEVDDQHRRASSTGSTRRVRPTARS